MGASLFVVDAFNFELPASATKCFSEEVAKDSLAVGSYKVPPEGGVTGAHVSLRVTGPTPMSVGASKTPSRKKWLSLASLLLQQRRRGATTFVFPIKADKQLVLALKLK